MAAAKSKGKGKGAADEEEEKPKGPPPPPHWKEDPWPPATVLPRPRLEEAMVVFHEYDNGGTGVVGVRDIGPMLRSLGYEPTEEELDYYVTGARRAAPDAGASTGAGVGDASGARVTQEQYLSILARIYTRFDTPTAVEEAFAVFDKEGTGMVPVAELRLALTRLGAFPQDPDIVDRLIEAADPSDSGFVRYGEYVSKLLADAEIAARMPKPEADDGKKKKKK